MKCMNRNKTLFHYAAFVSSKPLEDEWGNTLGEMDLEYGNPVPCFANISAAKGETQVQQFGNSLVYDKIIVMDDNDPPIDEYSILWVDMIPALNPDGSLSVNDDGEIITPHDYIVKKVAKSINSVSIAISKVNAGG